MSTNQLPPDLGNIPHLPLNNLPAAEAPPDVKPNFIDPETRGSTLVVVATVLLGLVLIFYLNRIYAKMFIIRKASWDDVTCTMGLLGCIAEYITALWGVTRGSIGKHQWDVSVGEMIGKDFIKPGCAQVVLIPLTMLFIKLSFFLLYFQIFRPMKWLRVSVYIGGTALCAFYGACTIANIVLVSPGQDNASLSKYETPSNTRAAVLSVPLSAVGLFFDIILLILPIAGVMQLQLSTRHKVGIALIFMIGFLACIGSLLSIFFRATFPKTSDNTWTLINIELMAIVEMYIGIICNCMPSLAKTMRHHQSPFQSLRSQFYSRLRGQSSDQGKAHRSNESDRTKGMASLPSRKSDHRRSEPYVIQGTDASRGYGDFSQPSHELAQLKSVRTYIGATQSEAPSDDRIHLTHEILQERVVRDS